MSNFKLEDKHELESHEHRELPFASFFVLLPSELCSQIPLGCVVQCSSYRHSRGVLDEVSRFSEPNKEPVPKAVDLCRSHYVLHLYL